jgi:hypothetical protein
MNAEDKENTKLAFKGLINIFAALDTPKDIQIVKESTYENRTNQANK